MFTHTSIQWPFGISQGPRFLIRRRFRFGTRDKWWCSQAQSIMGISGGKTLKWFYDMHT
nr:hypothetical protein [Providencia rettgeri]